MPPRSSRSVSLLVAQQTDGREEQDLEVEQRRPVPQVLEIVIDARLHILHPGGLTPAAVDLRQSGDSGRHLVPDHVALDELAIFLVVRDRMRPRTHETHVTMEDVDEQWKIIKRVAAHKATNI